MVTKAKTGVTRANTEALCLHTGLNPEDIIEVNWKSGNFKIQNMHSQINRTI